MTRPTELARALAAFLERPEERHTALAHTLGLPVPDEEVWTQVVLFNLFPYASVHLGDEGMLGGEARDRVAGFFRALDTSPPSEPDHLVVLLRAWAELGERADQGEERAALAADTLVAEHVLPWVPQYAARMTALAPSPYAEWGTLLGDLLRAMAADVPRQLMLPLHLRAAAAFVDPRTVEEPTLVADLLAPIRCGFVITTADLRRAGRETGLGLRVGERRYVLEQLLGQSVPTVLSWLADHAVASAEDAWDPWRDVAPRIADWWCARARMTATLLAELADEAEHAEVVPVL